MPVEGAELLRLQRHQWYQGSTQIKASIAQYIYQHSKAPSRITWHLL